VPLTLPDPQKSLFPEETPEPAPEEGAETPAPPLARR
jgi:hypothetical protein